MAALNHFVSRLGERAMPFYKLLKMQDKFQWTPKAQQDFDELKKFLTNPLCWSHPCPKNHCCFTLQQHLTSSARLSSLKDKSKAIFRRSNAQYTSSTKSWVNPR